MMEFFLLTGQMGPSTEHGGKGQVGLTMSFISSPDKRAPESLCP